MAGVRPRPWLERTTPLLLGLRLAKRGDAVRVHREVRPREAGRRVGRRRRRVVEAAEAEPDALLALGHLALDLEDGEEVALPHERGQREIAELEPGDLDLVPGAVVEVELGVAEEAGGERALERRQLHRGRLAERAPRVERPGDPRPRGAVRLRERERLRARAAHRLALDGVAELHRRGPGAVR